MQILKWVKRKIRTFGNGNRNEKRLERLAVCERLPFADLLENLPKFGNMDRVLIHQLHQRKRDLEKATRRNSELDRRNSELEKASRQLEQKNKTLERLASTDPLTGLPNRRAMDRLAKRELLRRERYAGPLAIGLIDVDRFMEINTQHHLPGGDKILIDLAQVLGSCVREVDVLGRFGGDRFMVIAPQTDMEGARIFGNEFGLP